MLTVCEKDQCAGCMLCVDLCKKDAITIKDNIKTYNAIIDDSKCVSCNLCHNKCPQNNSPTKARPYIWYQGWNKDETIRKKAPSGGVGMALARKFISDGGYVSSCTFQNGEFIFDIVNNLDDVFKFAGSKYVKSNPRGIYNRILGLLKDDKKVLFIGLPCQVAALKNYIGDKYAERLYLVDLICHGTPSPRLLDIFLKQYSKSLYGVKDIRFRIKAKMQVVVDGQGIVCTGVSDKYTIGFLNGLTYTNNCYSCHYACEERVSDITIGDSWGSNLSEEAKNGISLALVMTQKGCDLINDSGVILLPVDENNAKLNNEQLVRPMAKDAAIDEFYEKLEKKGFNKLIFHRFKLDCIKQDIKYALIRIGIIH